MSSSHQVSRGVFIACFLTLFSVIFSFTLSLMAGVYIVSELGGNNYTSPYAVSFFAIGNAISIPLGSVLWIRIGLVRWLIISLISFCFFSFLCGLSTTFVFFLTCRFLQGIASGPLYAIVNRLLFYLTPEKKKSFSTAVLLTIFSITPVIGACWGGVIAYLVNWRLAFFVDIPLLASLAIYLGIRLKGFDGVVFPLKKEPNSFDWIGFFSYAIGITCIGFVLTTGQEIDWFRSALFVKLTVIGTIFLIFYCLWGRGHPHPLFDFSLIRKPILIFALASLALIFSAYFGTVILLSLWLKLFVQYTPFWIGVLLGTMIITGLFPAFLIRQYGITDTRLPLILALIFLAVSCFHATNFSEDINFERVAISRFLAGFGLAFFLPPLFRLSFRNFSEEKSIEVLTWFQVTRALASGIGVSLYTTLWQRREVFYHERLGAQLTAFSESTKTFFVKAKEINISGQAADVLLDTFLQRQSYALALDDCFYFMGWVFTVLLIFTLLTYLLPKNSEFYPEKKEVMKV